MRIIRKIVSILSFTIGCVCFAVTLVLLRAGMIFGFLLAFVFASIHFVVAFLLWRLSNGFTNKISEMKKMERVFRFPKFRVRKTVDGYFYFDKRFNPSPEKYVLTDFMWDGPKYKSYTKDITEYGPYEESYLYRAAIGGSRGIVLDEMENGHRAREAEVIRTVVGEKEINSYATFTFTAVDTGKQIIKVVPYNTNLAKKYLVILN